MGLFLFFSEIQVRAPLLSFFVTMGFTRRVCVSVCVIFKAPFSWQENHNDGALGAQTPCDLCLMERRDISRHFL